jgi:hypothetical protein
MMDEIQLVSLLVYAIVCNFVSFLFWLGETAGVDPPNLFSNDSDNVPLSSTQTNEKPSKW